MQAMNYEDMDFKVLEKLYAVKSKELEQDLLSGIAWEEVRLKRRQLTELSEAMHRKLLNRNPSASAPYENDDDGK
jgi:hypothetical protein